MAVFIFGIVTIAALVWLIAFTLANEADAERRRTTSSVSFGQEEESRVGRHGELQAA